MTKLTKKEKAKDARLRREYHVTLKEHNKVFKYQEGKCAICKRPVGDFHLGFAVDHDHLTGEVRGLLCWTCNKALAIFGDNVDRLLYAAAYLANPPFRVIFGEPRITAPGRVGTKRRAKLLKAMKKVTKSVTTGTKAAKIAKRKG
jgi:hypothetical protein